MKTQAEMRRRFMVARLGGDPADTFGAAKLSDFDFAGQAEFGRIMDESYASAPERVWHGHTWERGYFLALTEAGLLCEHPLPMRHAYGSGWVCAACDVAVAPALR